MLKNYLILKHWLQAGNIMSHPQNQKSILVKLLIIIFFISIGLLLLLFNRNEIELSFGVIFLFVGLILLYYFIKNNPVQNKTLKPVSYDERSEINRLRASDLSFRFMFISINLLIILYALNWVPDNIIIVFLGPIVGLSVIIYFMYFYLTERQVE